VGGFRAPQVRTQRGVECPGGGGGGGRPQLLETGPGTRFLPWFLSGDGAFDVLTDESRPSHFTHFLLMPSTVPHPPPPRTRKRDTADDFSSPSRARAFTYGFSGGWKVPSPGARRDGHADGLYRRGQLPIVVSSLVR